MKMINYSSMSKLVHYNAIIVSIRHNNSLCGDTKTDSYDCNCVVDSIDINNLDD